MKNKKMKATLVCNSIAELIQNSDIIFTMLSNNEAVKEVYATILEENIAGKQSTVSS